MVGSGGRWPNNSWTRDFRSGPHWEIDGASSDNVRKLVVQMSNDLLENRRRCAIVMCLVSRLEKQLPHDKNNA